MNSLLSRRRLVVGGAILVLISLLLGLWWIIPKPASGTSTVQATFTNLPALSHGHYEAWAYFDFSRDTVSLGKFQIRDTKMTDLSGKTLSALTTTHPVSYAERFFITIEADGDVDSVPSDSIIMDGMRVGSGADLAVAFLADLPAVGQAELVTRTDASIKTKSGVWFVDDAGKPLIDLPELSKGWQYGAFTSINGVELQMGTFSSVEEKDNFDEYSKKKVAVDGAGEDFLRHLPRELKDAGLVAPLDLTKTPGSVMITLESSFHGSDPTGSGRSPWILFQGTLSSSENVALTNQTKTTLPSGRFEVR